jgi:hypothetical protein
MAETRRINRGAGHSYLLDGEPVASVTGILSNGVPKPALIDWAARETAAYAVNNWDELAREGLAQRLRKIEKGRFQGFREAGARGTAIHKYAERLLKDEEVDVPDAYRDHVDQCLRFLEDWQVHEVAVEVTVINRRWRYMGTADLVARVGPDPSVMDYWLLDWKTGGGYVYPETALQLAAYAHAETWLVDGPDGTPASSEIAACPIVHAAAVLLRADYYEVVPVDVSEATFRTFLYAQQLAAFLERDRHELIGAPLPLPSSDD